MRNVRSKSGAAPAAFFILSLAAIAPDRADALSVREIPDAPTILGHLLGRTPLSGQPLAQADRNGDGAIDIGDIIRAVDHPAPTPAPTASASPTPTISPEPTPGGNLTLTLPGGGTMERVSIPAGSFEMGRYRDELGSFPEEDPPAHGDHRRRPAHGPVRGHAGQWEAVTGSNPATGAGVGADYPVYNVSWNDIVGPGGFLETLNAHLDATGQNATVRLPGEAEWEYGYRAGTTTRFYFGDSLACGDECEDCPAGALTGNRTDYMWYCANNGESGAPDYGTKEVGLKTPNPWGLHDMNGNVAEWCQDNWHNDYTGTPADGSPWGEGNI